MDFGALIIQSPKQTRATQRGWDGFFPYYAGYPEVFARTLLESACLPTGSIVLDPWNGSGTTTYSASQLGLQSKGFDLNPAMVTIARARLLPPTEADSLEPLARETIKSAETDPKWISPDDPLLWWFDTPTAANVRTLERRIRSQLVGERTLTPTGIKLDNISGLAATFYVALFSVARKLSAPFRSSNPTWLRKPKSSEHRVVADRADILSAFEANVKSMAVTLARRCEPPQSDLATAELKYADTASIAIPEGSIDMILTSPPYCTRIDYTAVTRVELALMHPLVDIHIDDLSRKMIGSTRVPSREISVDAAWGPTCNEFLSKLKTHQSKASAGYYYRTHLDYFDKIAQSLSNLSKALKPLGAAIFIVQDSYYKEIHNDLPKIACEMASAVGLQLRRREDFPFKRSMSGINRHTRSYRKSNGATESVLCFERIGTR